MSCCAELLPSCITSPLPPPICCMLRFFQPTTPEFSKGLPKVNFPSRAMVLKSQYRTHIRFKIFFPFLQSGVAGL